MNERNLFAETVEIRPNSETSVTILLGDQIDPKLHQKISAISSYLQKRPFPGMIEVVPAFASLTVFYNPIEVQVNRESVSTSVCSILENIVKGIDITSDSAEREIIIPVCYGGEFGPDLEFVAEYNKLSTDEVIAIHSEKTYLVYMIGFAPGFPYLGGLSERIATPRKENPRFEIPSGAVGIGGSQTGVYSISTPGGWQLIGQTPMELFLPDEDPPSVLRSGDVVRFQSISEDEYYSIKEGKRWL